VWAHKERQITTRTDGHDSVQIEIFKEADTNIVSLAHRVKERLGRVDPEQPPEPAGSDNRRGRDGRPAGLAEELYRNEGIVLKVVADRSVFIEGSIAEVSSCAISNRRRSSRCRSRSRSWSPSRR